MGAGIASIIVAIFTLFVGGAFKKVPNQKKTKGIIHSIEFAEYDRGSTSDDRGHNMYYYHIQYMVNGKEYLLKTKSTSSVTDVVGKKRTVKYNNNNPEQAIECPSNFIYVFASAFFIFGLYAILSTV